MTDASTPRPWRIHEPNPYTANIVKTIVKDLSPDHVNIVATVIETSSEGVCNARLIVRAVNAHDDLVAALRFCFDVLCAQGFEPDPGEPSMLKDGVWDQAIAKARAALAKAGEP